MPLTTCSTAGRIIAGVLLMSLLAACGAAGGPTTHPTSVSSSGPSQPATSGQPTPAPTATFAAQPGAVTLVAYSTPREAYDALIPLFQATSAGTGVEFEQSYGASGDQSRAVEAGLPADFVEFSLAPDMDRLVKAGIVAQDWNAGQYKGMVTDSVVVFVVRKGNPKGINSWDDLAADGVGVIEPNPFTSGGARWNVMAAYGALIKQGKSEDEAVQFLTDLFGNVLVQDKSARDSLQTFLAGQGDVLLAYENEAILAQQGGQDIDFVVPDQTILIENPAAVTATGGDAQAQAKSFLDFLYTTDAQQVFADKGYRAVLEGVTPSAGPFPQPSGLFTIDDLGGWPDVATRFFDKTNGIVAQIERGLGINP